MAKQYSNKLTLEALTALKFSAEITQYIIPRCHQRRDMYRFIDVMGVREDFGILAVQATTPGKLNEHKEKIAKSEVCRLWVMWAHLHIWSWPRVGPKGMMMFARPQIEKAVLVNGVVTFVPFDGSLLKPKILGSRAMI